MQLHVVRRVAIAASAAELDAALLRLRTLEETPHPLQANWLHSYALREADGRLGLACIFQAEDGAVLQEHARLCRLPAHEILPVAVMQVERAFSPTRVHLVRRRGAWPTPADFDRGTAAARHVAEDEMPREVSWLRSYTVREADGSLGSVCLYQGLTPQAVHRHAERAGLPADDIRPVLGRIVFREPHRSPSLAPGATTA
jgi:hypothetical protein